MRFLYLVIFLAVPPMVSAASVVKCVDAAGKVTFSQHACPSPDHDVAVVSVNNQRPSGEGPATRLADPSRPAAAPGQGQAYTVVGEREKLPDAPIQAERPRVAPAAQGPCVRMVDRQVNSTRVTKDGKRVGRAEIIKVPVPC
ncbi:hypothetical protein [Ectopseudomonas mendocina]|uniref:hypothetical protein n=1 Tax=Ectopseudomonas mendocina TaxID=300 RepID=UPI00376F1CAD